MDSESLEEEVWKGKTSYADIGDMRYSSGWSGDKRISGVLPLARYELMMSYLFARAARAARRIPAAAQG